MVIAAVLELDRQIYLNLPGARFPWYMVLISKSALSYFSIQPSE